MIHVNILQTFWNMRIFTNLINFTNFTLVSILASVQTSPPKKITTKSNVLSRILFYLDCPSIFVVLQHEKLLIFLQEILVFDASFSAAPYGDLA